MDNTDYIGNCFKGNSTDAEKKEFEKMILEDELFAQHVAFYISANGFTQQQLIEEKRQRFSLKENKVVKRKVAEHLFNRHSYFIKEDMRKYPLTGKMPLTLIQMLYYRP